METPLCGVANEPVRPVEDGASPVVGVAAHHGDQGLHEAQSGADDAQDRVRAPLLGDGDLRPALMHFHSISSRITDEHKPNSNGRYLQLKEDEDDAGDGQSPGSDHEEPVPDEPLVELAALGAGPGLLEVASEEHANGGEEHPGADHECPVQLHFEVLVGGQFGHGAEILQKDCTNKLLQLRFSRQFSLH